MPIAGSDISPPPPPAGLSFPHGLVAFVIGGCTPGSTLSLTLHLPAAMPSDTAFWKFGPTPDDHAPHWYRIPATVSGSAVTFTIVDGGLGDDDVTANGTVVDAGGPAIAAAVDPAEAIPALSHGALALMAIALALLATAALRSRAGPR